MLGSSFDVCNLNLIYTTDYNYSLPREVLKKWSLGRGFDYTKFYSTEERDNLCSDIREIFADIVLQNPIKKPLAVITAGAPGSGKTIKLLQDLAEKKCLNETYAYICPDDVCLKKQKRTYLADIQPNDTPADRQAAYNKWRPGSNAAAHLILANLIRNKYAFYFGSTSSGEKTGRSFEFLKNQGYEIRLIHVTAPDKVRWESIKERDKTFVQTTEKDVEEKGDLLPQRINDTFLKYADVIEFYYRGQFDQDAQLAATWTRDAKCVETPLGDLQIKDRSLYEKIIDIHNTATETIQRADLRWEVTVEAASKTSLPAIQCALL